MSICFAGLTSVSKILWPFSFTKLTLKTELNFVKEVGTVSKEIEKTFPQFSRSITSSCESFKLDGHLLLFYFKISELNTSNLGFAGVIKNQASFDILNSKN